MVLLETLVTVMAPLLAVPVTARLAMVWPVPKLTMPAPLPLWPLGLSLKEPHGAWVSSGDVEDEGGVEDGDAGRDGNVAGKDAVRGDGAGLAGID